MKPAERIEKLRALLDSVGGTIESKKKLHKLIYLLQQDREDFDQDFVFHHYGVFSFSLEKDIELAEADRVISVTTPTDDRWAHTIQLLKKESTYPVALSPDSIKRACRFAKMSPQLLEVLSTIVYLSRNHYTDDDLLFKLSELKPKLSQHYVEAYELAEELYGITA